MAHAFVYSDPVQDAAQYFDEEDEEFEAFKELCPTCKCCENKITGEFYYMIGDAFYCEDCIEECRHDIDDYVRQH